MKFEPDRHSTSLTSDWAQGFFQKVSFLNSVHSKKKDGVCLGFLVKIFSKSLCRGGVDDIMVRVGQRLDLVFASEITDI